eukprot:2346629-Ditylum_brightwellii.AAC.1
MLRSGVEVKTSVPVLIVSPPPPSTTQPPDDKLSHSSQPSSASAKSGAESGTEYLNLQSEEDGSSKAGQANRDDDDSVKDKDNHNSKSDQFGTRTVEGMEEPTVYESLEVSPPDTLEVMEVEKEVEVLKGKESKDNVDIGDDGSEVHCKTEEKCLTIQKNLDVTVQKYQTMTTLTCHRVNALSKEAKRWQTLELPKIAVIHILYCLALVSMTQMSPLAMCWARKAKGEKD